MKKALVIDLGGTKVRVSLVDVNGKVYSKPHLKQKVMRAGNKQLTEQIFSMIDSLFKEFNVSKKDIIGIGVGSAGIIDRKNLTINDAPNLLDISRTITFPRELKKKAGLPVYLINDTSAGALGSYYFGYGKNKRYKVVVYLTLSTGTNIGVVIGGKVFNGAKGMSPELGHIRIEKNGKRCNDGALGHLEPYISGSGIEGTAKAIFRKSISGRQIFDLAWDGNQKARAILDDSADYLAAAFGIVISLFSPDLIEIGGGLIKNRDLLVTPAIKRLSDPKKYINYTLIKPQFHPLIKITKLGDDIVTKGAGVFVFNKGKLLF